MYTSCVLGCSLSLSLPFSSLLFCMSEGIYRVCMHASHSADACVLPCSPLLALLVDRTVRSCEMYMHLCSYSCQHNVLESLNMCA